MKKKSNIPSKNKKNLKQNELNYKSLELENEILGKGATAVVRKGIKIDTGEAYAIKI